MKERIIVVPYVNALSSSLTYSGKNLYNTRIYTPIELVNDYLIRTGDICDKHFISKNEELYYFKNIIDEVSYFNTTKLEDIKNINKAINDLRKLVIFDEQETIKQNLSKGIFIEKNNALYTVYKKYIDTLSKENKIDTIGLYRYALDNNEKLDIEIILLDEYKLQPLEYELVKHISDNVRNLTLFDLYEVNKNDIHIESIKNCYGSSNEVASIIDDIYSNYNADQCVIACADYHSYSQIIYDYACKYNFDVTFADGLSTINSYPGKLLKQYFNWCNEGYGQKPLLDLINSPYFNLELFNSLINQKNIKDFYSAVAKLRLTNDETINIKRISDFKQVIFNSEINNNSLLQSYCDDIEIIAKQLALPVEEFINKYALLRNDNEFVSKFDEAGKKSIIKQIKEVKEIGLDISDDIVKNIIKKPIFRQSNKPGHLHVTTIQGGLSSLRNNLYVCGLSSSVYPGSAFENPLLLDCDLKDFNNETLTSKQKVKDKKNELLDLISLACALNNKVFLSYPGLNVSELKNNNSSSLIYEIYKQENGEDKSLNDFKNSVINVDYFNPNLSKSKLIGEEYIKTSNILYKALDLNNKNKTIIDIGKYSPSALNTFFNCRKQFFYQNILKIEQPEEYKPYEVIPATEQGTLVHALMEYLADHKISKDDFIKLAENVFDEYMKINVPLIPEKANDAKEEFVEMLANGWQMDHDNPRKVAFKEEDKDATHKISGVVIHGYPDRVELTEDGKAVIIDFKTERSKNNHISDDIDTCLQVIIYAYIVENTLGLKVDHLEYRMLRFNNGIITCKYDEEIKNQLDEKLIEFKKAIDSGDFSIEPMTSEEEVEKCKYCKYASICKKEVIDG